MLCRWPERAKLGIGAPFHHVHMVAAVCVGARNTGKSDQLRTSYLGPGKTWNLNDFQFQCAREDQDASGWSTPSLRQKSKRSVWVERSSPSNHLHCKEAMLRLRRQVHKHVRRGSTDRQSSGCAEAGRSRKEKNKLFIFVQKTTLRCRMLIKKNAKQNKLRAKCQST